MRSEIVEDTIKSDTDDVLGESDEVHQDANSIDCSALIQAPARVGGEGPGCHSHEDDSDDRQEP